MIVSSVEKGLLLGIAVTDSFLFITGVWSFIICYMLLLIGLTFYVYFNQEP